MTHIKKVHPPYFQYILDGKKTYELRLADWKCEEGDTLVLQEWDPKTEDYTGREITKTVSYVGTTKDQKWWSKEEVDKYGFQIISFE